MPRLMPVMRHILGESLHHTAAMAPVMLLVFFFMEWVAHRAENKWISKAIGHRLAGPVVAAAFGLLPQCGFSVASTMLYVGGLIPMGSLLSTYIATSDEAIPILLAHPTTLGWVLPLLATKLLWGATLGILINFTIARKTPSPRYREVGSGINSEAGAEVVSSGDVHLRRGHAGWVELVFAAIARTLRIALWIFLMSSAMGLAGHALEPWMSRAASGQGFLRLTLSSVIGMIPSCATSVALAEGFRSGLLPFSALLSGLTANAGLGLFVLARESKDRRDSVLIATLLLVSALSVGFLAETVLRVGGG